MTTVNELDLENLHLDQGAHNNPSDGHCLMEVVSMFAKEPFTDSPKCVSPYLRRFGIGLNDRASDARRQDLLRFVPLVVGTDGDGLDEQRRWLAHDHITRTLLPKWLDRANLSALASECRELPAITDRDGYLAARELIQRVRDVTYPLRQKRYATVRAAATKAVQDHYAAGGKSGAAAAAVAVAVADAAADAVAVADAAAAADADAVAVAVAAADAVAVAVAVAVARYGDRWYKVRRATYDAVYPKIRAAYEERYGDLASESWNDALGLYERLINPVTAVSA